MNTTVNTSPALAWEKMPVAELIRLSWPMVLSHLSFSIMTLVDTLFVGRLGAVELAAVGLGGVCSFTVLSFGFAVLAAAKVKVSECYGTGDTGGVNRALGAFLRLAFALGVAGIGGGQIIAWLLPLLTTDGATGHLAREYTSIRAWGFLASTLSAAVGQWFQAQGDSRSAMRATLIANVANIPLNAGLIFGLGWGVAGAAWASVGSVCIEALWLLTLQMRKTVALPGARNTTPGLHLGMASWRDAQVALQVGLPTGMERVLDMIAFSAVPLLLARLGPHHVAAHQIVLQIMLLSFLPLWAVSESLSVLVAQAVGAGRTQLIHHLIGQGLRVALGYAAFCGLICLALPRQLVGLFTPDSALVELGSVTLMVGAVLQFINAAYIQLKGILRGLSVFRFVAVVTAGCAWVITPPLTYFIGVRAGFGAPGAWVVLCIEVALGSALLHSYLRKKTAELAATHGPN